MSGLDLEPWEPEETVGKLWHACASRFDAPEAHEGDGVDLEEVEGRLATFFHGLGRAGAGLAPAAPEASRRRLGWRRRVAVSGEKEARARWDGETLRLPARIALFPDARLNAALYFWLTAFAAHAPAFRPEPDPIRADLRAIAESVEATRAALTACPGLRATHARLTEAVLAARRARPAAGWEADIEAAAMAALRGEAVSLAPPDAAPRVYRPLAHVPLWVDRAAPASGLGADTDGERSDGAAPEGPRGLFRAKRRKSDQAARRDSLILHKFEAIFSWADFIDVNRKVDDDDLDNAKKAAEDLDELALGQVSKAPAARLKLHLDLSPEDAARERLSGEHLQPEWDTRAGAYIPDHVRILASAAEEAAPPPPDPHAERRIRAVRRQFEALRPARVTLSRQAEGEELDLDAAIASQADLRACGEGSDRVWRQTRPQARDLSVAILLDISRSTESAASGERSVIAVEKEALTALAHGLGAAGDECALYAFSSVKRDRVFVLGVKDFGEAMGPAVERRLAGLQPGFYTRLGAAMRHVSGRLSERPSAKRLMLVVTDGKPNDLDHYEGRHGVEDSRMAVREARRAGHAVHGVVIGHKSETWLPRIFGRGGFSVIAEADRLTGALPDIYRHLVR